MGVGFYLVAGLLIIGGLFWILTQIAIRHRRLQAELTRLEQLAAEVALNAESLLDQVDERVTRLDELSLQLEQRALALSTAPLPDPSNEEAGEVVAGQVQSEPKRRAKARTSPAKRVITAATAGEQPAEATLPANRYKELAVKARELAAQGKDAGEIAQTLVIPRGEVQLLLNLRQG